MKTTNLLLIGGLAVGSYFLIKSITSPGGSAGESLPAADQATNILNSQKIALIKSGQTTPTPTMTPSKKIETTTKAIQKSTGIKYVTNTMPVTKSVTNALKGTISPLTGKLRV